MRLHAELIMTFFTCSQTCRAPINITLPVRLPACKGERGGKTNLENRLTDFYEI